MMACLATSRTSVQALCSYTNTVELLSWMLHTSNAD